jgi:hypothetical protein
MVQIPLYKCRLRKKTLDIPHLTGKIYNTSTHVSIRLQPTNFIVTIDKQVISSLSEIDSKFTYVAQCQIGMSEGQDCVQFT